MCEKCGYEHTKENARKLWRKHGFGRLYYKHNNPQMYKSWVHSDMNWRAKRGPSSLYMQDAEAVIHTALRITDW